MRKLVLALSVPLFALAAPASAHFNLTMPPSTSGDAAGKGVPPCGPDGASAAPTSATGGQTLKIHVDETVAHTGFYRIALSINSRSELPIDPVVKDKAGNVLSPLGKPDGTSDTAAYEDPAVFPVLVDHLWVHDQNAGPKGYDTTITLPNVTCAKCTLQVIEFMSGHGYNYTVTKTSMTDPGGGYWYHHCADLKITADPNKPIFDPNAASGGAGGAGGMSSAGAGGAATAGSGGEATGGTGGAGETGGASAGAPTSVGSAGISAGGAIAVAGSPGVAGASASTGGAGGGTAVPASDDQSSGCSFGTLSSNAKPELAALLGLLMLGVRRRHARAAR